MTLSVIKFQPNRHKRVASGHPWVYSNEITMDNRAKSLESGTMVQFCANDGTPLGIGSFNSRTLIAGRIFSRAPLGVVDEAWFEARLNNALALRERFLEEPFYRLVHAEADGLPGLIVDRFDKHLGVQLNTAGMQMLWPVLESVLVKMLKPSSIVLHNDSSIRTLEGLDRHVTVVRGEIEGPVELCENGVTYFADPVGGQKTGWYFDQRDNHALMARYAKGARVLDLFCHAGGFALQAAKAGAIEVVGVDSSQPALDLAEKATKHNKLGKRCTWHRAEVFQDLERRRAAKESYDIVIADPPPFVKSRKDLAVGARGYRKLAKLAAQVTAPNGLLFLASCSYNMDLPSFTEEVARGLMEAKRTGAILHTVFAAPDHPVHPNLPESAYLKGLVLRVA